MTEIASGIHSLGHKKGGHVHAFLLDDGGELSLVDTLFEGDARLVLEAIRGLGRTVADLKRIALTHGHRSHLGGLATLKRASGAKFSRTRGRRTSSAATAARSRSRSCRSNR